MASSRCDPVLEFLSIRHTLPASSPDYEPLEAKAKSDALCNPGPQSQCPSWQAHQYMFFIVMMLLVFMGAEGKVVEKEFLVSTP